MTAWFSTTTEERGDEKMTEDQCNACRHAGYIAFVDGDMWCCAKDDDPSMPFYMDENTFCPCFEKDDGRYDESEVE